MNVIINYPLVICFIAIENGSVESSRMFYLSNGMVDLSSSKNVSTFVYKRVYKVVDVMSYDKTIFS